VKQGDPSASVVLEYTTKELSRETLPDFERLFETHPAPGAFPCWCMYNHRSVAVPESQKAQSSDKRAARNRKQKRKLVADGCTHGILVYANEEPIGWCQYGAAEELPRMDNNPQYRKLARERLVKSKWRITCFVVRRIYRRRGVASVALQAALAAIRNRGGGLVEAYPLDRWVVNAEYRGTVSMFRKEGFEIVAPLGKNNVVMQRII
jgi:GNAT superfamily N-acetyltransferase